MSAAGDLRGKTVLVTGANAGIGAATAKALAARGARVYAACRSEAKTRPVLDAITRDTGNADLHFLPLDLGDLDSVRACAGAFLARGEPLDVLVENAGVARAPGTTRQGYEAAFGINHLGHFLLALLLEPALARATPSRVVVVASRAHERTSTPIDLEAVRGPPTSRSGWPEYQRSKLANMLFARALARRWAPRGIHVYAVHPGVIASDLWRSVPGLVRPLLTAFMKTPEAGARSSVHCATSPGVAAHTGRYYDEDGSERRPSALALDDAAADALWAWSLAATEPWRAPLG